MLSVMGKGNNGERISNKLTVRRWVPTSVVVGTEPEGRGKVAQ